MHTCVAHLVKLFILYKAPSQVVRAGKDSFTVLAGRPQAALVAFNQDGRPPKSFFKKTAHEFSVPAHACKERAQLRQRHTLAHTH